MTSAGSDPQFSFITNRHGEQLIYEVNRDTFNQTGADAQFKRQFGRGFQTEDTLFLILGSDSGLLPLWLRDNSQATGSRYVCIELPEVIDAVREQLGDALDDTTITVVTPEEFFNDPEAVSFNEYIFINRVKIVPSFACLDAFLPDYRLMQLDIDRAMAKLSRAAHIQVGNFDFITKQIENCGDNLTPATCLKDACDGGTAVLLGGGPSLDTIIPWVKAHRDQLVVIAVSRVCRQLLECGLNPDIVVSIDPYPISFDVSKEALRFPPETLLVTSHHVTHMLLGQWQGPTAYRGPHYPWQCKTEPDNLPTVGPTVSNQALATAIDMGFKRIVLGGVDLCFDRSGNTYASGSNEAAVGPKLGTINLQVRTHAGWMADTLPGYADAVTSMGAQAEKAVEQGCDIININEGAAQIPHVRFQPLEDIEIAGSAQRPRQQIVQALPAQDAAYRLGQRKAVLKELARAHDRLRAVAKLCDEALHCNRGLFGRNGKAPDYKYKLRMDKIERRLDKDYEDVTILVKRFNIRGFLHLNRPGRHGDWSDAEIEEWGQNYYDIYRASCEQVLGLIESTQQRLRSRLDEDAAEPDLAQLIDQWRADDTPGRHRVWQRQRQAAGLPIPPGHAADLAELDAAFEAELENRDTTQARIAKADHSLAPVRSKLLVLFQTENSDELQTLTDNLAALDDPEARELTLLGQAYLAELSGATDQALGYHQQIVDLAADQLTDTDQERQHNPRLEDALRRMSFITLNRGDGDNALLVLDVLSSLSPAYEPQYAALLAMTGHIEDAIHLYTRYLEKAPQDLAAMLRLGRLFQDAGIHESAGLAYRYILDQDPDNRTARQLLDALGEQASPT